MISRQYRFPHFEKKRKGKIEAFSPFPIFWGNTQVKPALFIANPSNEQKIPSHLHLLGGGKMIRGHMLRKKCLRGEWSWNAHKCLGCRQGRQWANKQVGVGHRKKKTKNPISESLYSNSCWKCRNDLKCR
ncbi:hypothetical protein AVEN_266512-1 [Araneus ventricosus]|uniref:Uncharacterized protein n=1 Tax=Araneus ventricosus TaxID=182803 RepID=A0A4Y2UHH2_ARAVE|nr:hypothetical protein AVEN_266512-1 [Araneus ventricosus]